MLNRYLLDNGLEQDSVVSSTHCVGRAGVDLNLSGTVLVI